MADRLNRNKRKIAVVGGGCAGLAAALRLLKNGHEVSVFEERERVGGLAGGVVINGNLYDYGPHLFHTTDPEILHDIQTIARDDIFVVQRSILIKFLGSYFKYPLSIPDAMSKLPPSTLFKAMLSFIYHNARSLLIKPKIRTSETVLLSQYGKVLYELFFKSYIEHVWGISPSQFSPKFASQRIPRLSAVDFLYKIVSSIHKTFSRHIPVGDYVENVEGSLYSTEKSFFGVAEKMAYEIERKGGGVHLDSRVTKIKRLPEGAFTVEVNSEERGEVYDGVISTAPLGALVDILEPSIDEDAKRAAKELKHRPIVFVGLLIKKEKVLPAAIMYFRELSFNRITDLSYFGIKVEPEKHTLIIAEIACDTNSRFWKDESHAAESVIRELLADNIVKG